MESTNPQPEVEETIDTIETKQVEINFLTKIAEAQTEKIKQLQTELEEHKKLIISLKKDDGSLKKDNGLMDCGQCWDCSENPDCPAKKSSN